MLDTIEPGNTELSGGDYDYIQMDNLKYPLTYVVCVSKGKIYHIELVTNGNEAWDGTIDGFHFM